MMNLQRPRGMSCNLNFTNQRPGPTPDSKLSVDTIPESARQPIRAQDTTKEYTHILPNALSQFFQSQTTAADNKKYPTNNRVLKQLVTIRVEV